MASPTFFSRGHTPTRTDTRWFILQRILGAIDDGGGGGGGGGAGLIGTVDPNGSVTADPGTPYTNRSNHTFWVQENTVSSNTGWVQYV